MKATDPIPFCNGKNPHTIFDSDEKELFETHYKQRSRSDNATFPPELAKQQTKLFVESYVCWGCSLKSIRFETTSRKPTFWQKLKARWEDLKLKYRKIFSKYVQ